MLQRRREDVFHSAAAAYRRLEPIFSHIQKIQNFLRDAFFVFCGPLANLSHLEYCTNSVATGHNKLFPMNKHCEIFMPVQKKKLNVARERGCLPQAKNLYEDFSKHSEL